MKSILPLITIIFFFTSYLWAQNDFLTSYKTLEEKPDNRESILNILDSGDRWGLVTIFSLNSFEQNISKLTDRELHRLYVGAYLLGYEKTKSFKKLHFILKDQISGNLIVNELKFFKSKGLNSNISVDGIFSLAKNSKVSLKYLLPILNDYKVNPQSVIDIKSQLSGIQTQLNNLDLTRQNSLSDFLVIRDHLVTIANIGENTAGTGEVCKSIFKWLYKNLTKNEETIHELYSSVYNIYSISDDKEAILKILNEEIAKDYQSISSKKTYLDFLKLRESIDAFMALATPKSFKQKLTIPESKFNYSNSIKGKFDVLLLKYLKIDIYVYLHKHGNKWVEEELKETLNDLLQFCMNISNFKNKEYYDKLYGLIHIEKHTNLLAPADKKKLLTFFEKNILKTNTDTQLLIEEGFGIKPDFGTNEITYEKILSQLKAKQISEVQFFKKALSFNGHMKDPIVYKAFKNNYKKLFNSHPIKLLRMFKYHAMEDDHNFLESIWYKIRPNDVDFYFEVLINRNLHKNYNDHFSRYSNWPLLAKRGVAKSLQYFIDYDHFSKTLKYLETEKDSVCISGFMDGLKIIISKILENPKSEAFIKLKEKLYNTESLSEWAILTTIIYDVDKISDYKFIKQLNEHRKSNLDKYFEKYEK